MAKQTRAVQTRRAILDAAASVFDEYGYERAAISEMLRRAGVTKGALYFHFPSKEAIAQAIMDEQTAVVALSGHAGEHSSPLQTVVNISQQFAFALRHDPIARAGTRLSVEGVFFGGPHPWGDWFRTIETHLERGKMRGEVLPHVDATVTAELIVASFTGIQLVSESTSKRADLRDRVTTLWQHLLPTIANPAVISWIKPEGILVTDPGSGSEPGPGGGGIEKGLAESEDSALGTDTEALVDTETLPGAAHPTAAPAGT
ncbi:TetR/AcrR family transcriptional regulator [Streptomyces sp. NA04227]|uniref:ScbR family autoregulator-binding transcription factor n=1 Tax=Streptomyces sp. NA04227 TaxID=2742136 RepID=UPI0015924133|nr:ScbR family autoregulator-binding transcription factor [Streptomyces sp. NA04227]QKW08434.1 TetR/AcrR family transcriptional regulator [Streptomyces sp. NA04227]